MQWLTVGYATAALVTALVAFIMSSRVSVRRQPPAVRAGLSLAAGLLWPLMLLGLLEFGSFVAYTKVAEPEITPLDIDVTA